MKQNQFPKGWNELRVQRALAHYENQSEEEQIAEDESLWVRMSLELAMRGMEDEDAPEHRREAPKEALRAAPTEGE
ncbi:MAG: hypothetical protein HY741_05505 [Chloroflexi bacterium]|nr:hypothetical protein [Chloroflexota bacterium]